LHRVFGNQRPLGRAQTERITITSLRRHLSYANVTATLSLFIALGGAGAYAAAQIGSSDIAKNAVKSKHIRNGQVRGADIGDAQVTSSEIADGQVFGSDVANGSIRAEDIEPGAFDLDVTVVEAQGTGSATPTCPAGTTLVGGGATGTGDDVPQSSRPLTDAWDVEVIDLPAGTGDAVEGLALGYAVCASISP
jgi:hypothetical protein